MLETTEKNNRLDPLLHEGGKIDHEAEEAEVLNKSFYFLLGK